MWSNLDLEIQTFIKVWITATVSVIYSRYIAASIPSGAARLLSILPVIYLFTTLPLGLSSFHLAGPTIFYLVWLGNFKLVLFSFDQGPLSPTPPLSLVHFIAIALFPIKPRSVSTPQNPSPKSSSIVKTRDKAVIFALKCFLLALIVYLYQYRDFIHPWLIFALYSCHLYLGVELILAVTAMPVRALVGLDLEPQFNEPYLATSLQDFWGNRWNLVVTGILRPTVYHPVRRVSSRVLGGDWSKRLAILATFVVSGLMHELIYYYFIRDSPSWEVTWFFVLHGFCVAIEVALKNVLSGRFRLPKAVSRALTVGFVAFTGMWLFFPQVIRYRIDRKAIKESAMLIGFVGEKLHF